MLYRLALFELRRVAQRHNAKGGEFSDHPLDRERVVMISALANRDIHAHSIRTFYCPCVQRIL